MRQEGSGQAPESLGQRPRVTGWLDRRIMRSPCLPKFIKQSSSSAFQFSHSGSFCFILLVPSDWHRYCQVACPKCGDALLPDSKFCRHCGCLGCDFNGAHPAGVRTALKCNSPRGTSCPFPLASRRRRLLRCQRRAPVCLDPEMFQGSN